MIWPSSSLIRSSKSCIFMDNLPNSAKTLALPIHPTPKEAITTRVCLERHLVDKDLVAKKVPRTQWHVLAVRMARHALS